VRILLAGCDSDDALGFTTRAVQRTLTRAGHAVELFDYRARRVLPARRFDRLFGLVRRLTRGGRLRLDLEPGRPVAIDPLVTLRPKPGIWMTARPRSA